MKQLSLLILSLFFGISGYAAVVQGTVVNMSSVPVANQIVHVTDSSMGVQIFSLMDTTDASGNYSITIPASTSMGALLHVFTEKCGVKSTSLQSYAGSSISVNFTVCGTTSGNTVSGTVTYVSPTGNPAYPAIVYLIKKNYSSATSAYVLTLLDSTNTASNGEYHFYGVTVSAGDLLVKAALLSSNSQYYNYLPTYKENSLTWSTAHAVSFTLGANDIHMVAGTNPGGPGFIGGSVLLGANKSTGVGDPLSGRIILLTTISDVAVAYAFSDASGQFSFPNLAYGSYKLFGDAMGKSNPEFIVTISAANSSISKIVFEENDNSFKGNPASLGVSPQNVLSGISIFPNPSRDLVYLNGLQSVNGSKIITLSDMQGGMISRQTITQGNPVVDMSSLAAGMYLLQVNTEAGNISFKVVRQ